MFSQHPTSGLRRLSSLLCQCCGQVFLKPPSRDLSGRLPQPVGRGCLRGLPLARRATAALLRVRNLAARFRVAADDREPVGTTLPFPTVVLRRTASRRPAHGPQGDLGDRRLQTVRLNHQQLDRRDVPAVHVAQANAKRPAPTGHSLASQLLPRRSRRQTRHQLELGSCRQKLPRDSKVRDAGV